MGRTGRVFNSVLEIDVGRCIDTSTLSSDASMIHGKHVGLVPLHPKAMT